MRLILASVGLVWASVYFCFGCSEAVGDLVIENQSSRDIVVKYPHDSPFSEVVPAHSKSTAFREIQISGRLLYADVFDAKTKKLLLKGPGSGEQALALGRHVLIIYQPKGDAKRRPMHVLPSTPDDPE